MKKFTLFFMSLFLVFGTAMAKDEVKDFNSPEVYPNNGAKELAVYNIRLKFPKHVTLTNSEVSIDVVNTSTDEVVKITSCAVDEWDPYYAVFYFEKIEVDGKDGKEYKDQVIDKPGTYTYTIPEGLITSTEGDVYAGGTFTFTIAAPVAKFPIKDYSPKETPELKEIVVTFDEEITEVKNIGSAAVMETNMWTYMSGFNGATINEDKKSVTLTLSSPITSVGNYHLELYSGIFLSANGENAYGWLDFKVIDPTPGFTTNYNDGDRVKELGNLEISFKNVTEVEKVEGEDFDIIAVLPSGAEIPGEVEQQGNKFVVSFDEDLTEDGDYMFIIPGGAFSMDGVQSEGRTLNVELFTFELKALEVVSVTPVVGDVENISQIVVKFNQYVKLYYDNDGVTPSQEIYLTCGDEMYKLTCTGGSPFISDELVYSRAEWDGFQYVYDPITAPGTYTLNLEDIIVFHGADDIFESEYYSYANTWHVGDASCKGTYSWTIKEKAEEDDAVDFIKAETGEQVIYDLLGRRVERINGAGIYIVNGKKVVIK